MAFKVPLDLNILLAELVGATTEGRGPCWQCPAPGSKSIEKADPVGSPADLDQVLPGKLQQIGACRGRQSQIGEGDTVQHESTNSSSISG